MIIKLEVHNENGKVEDDCVDLTNKFLDRGISQTSHPINYTADDKTNFSNDPQQGINNQFNAVSGGQILPLQSVNKIDKISGEVQQFNKPISVNIKIRYDANEPLNSRWNIDLYVDLDDNRLNWNEKRLITRRPQRAHKAPDSDWIRVDYWIDCVKQHSIKNNRP